MSDKKTEYVYSHNGTDWTDEYEDAKALAIDHRCESDPYEVTIHRAERSGFVHSDFVCGHPLIESIQEMAVGQVFEHADGYLDDLSLDDIDELEDLVTKFLASKAAQPRFYLAINPDEETVQLTEEEING